MAKKRSQNVYRKRRNYTSTEMILQLSKICNEVLFEVVLSFGQFVRTIRSDNSFRFVERTNRNFPRIWENLRKSTRICSLKISNSEPKDPTENTWRNTGFRHEIIEKFSKENFQGPPIALYSLTAEKLHYIWIYISKHTFSSRYDAKCFCFLGHCLYFAEHAKKYVRKVHKTEKYVRNEHNKENYLSNSN